MNKGVDFFYHATGDDDESLKRMLAIIESGAIYSKRKLGITDRGLFNGQNYISVAAWNDDMNINHFHSSENLDKYTLLGEIMNYLKSFLFD